MLICGLKQSFPKIKYIYFIHIISKYQIVSGSKIYVFVSKISQVPVLLIWDLEIDHRMNSSLPCSWSFI